MLLKHKPAAPLCPSGYGEHIPGLWDVPSAAIPQHQHCETWKGSSRAKAASAKI